MKRYPFWFSSVGHFHKSKTLHTLFLSLVVVAVYTYVVLYVEYELLDLDFQPPAAIFSLLGIVLGLLLVFRTNTAYERWWDGRKLLGSLTNCSRNFSMKLQAYIPIEDKESRAFFAKMIPNYAFAMKEHLREGVKFEELEEYNGELFEKLKKRNHVPNKIAGLIYEKIEELYKKGSLTKEHFLVLNANAEMLTDIVGGCERIRNTPIPFAYSIHLKKFIFLFMIVLPFGFGHEMKYWTIPTMLVIFFAFVGLEVIGEEIEDPFGNDVNDLPMDNICTKIRANVNEIFETN